MFLLPLIAFVLVFLIFLSVNKNLVRSLANTWLCVSILILMATEFLSLFKMWTITTVSLGWIVVCLACGMYIYRKKSYIALSAYIGRGGSLQDKIKAYKPWLIIFAVYLLVLIVTAALSGQSNVDSLIYHLPRIRHWIQNKSVGHYATSTSLQIRYTALSEYMVAQIILLGGNDRLANMIQAGSYISTAIMIFGISRRIGVSVKFSFVASWLYLLMPMAMIQAYTAQTDDIAGMFLIVFIYFILDFIQSPKLRIGKQGVKDGVRLASSVVLGYLCKPTICFMMLVFFVWMCFVRICRKDKVGILMKYILVGVITATLLFMPLLLKTYHTYIAGQDEIVVENETSISADTAMNTVAPDSLHVVRSLKSPKLFVMMCLQNFGINAASNSFPLWNDFILKVVNKAGHILDYDTGGFALQQGEGYFACDTASNPTIMICGFLAFMCVLLHLSKVSKEQAAYVILAFAGFVIQCGLMGFTYFRTRYLVGAMAVLCPAIFIVLDKLKVRLKVRESILISLVVVACFGGINTFGYEMNYVKNGLMGNKIHQYFRSNYREFTHTQVIDYVNSNRYTKVGIEGKFTYEYVLWQGIENLERLESVNVNVRSLEKYEDKSFMPECIIEESDEPKEMNKLGTILECHGTTYECVWTLYGNAYHYSVYVPLS